MNDGRIGRLLVSLQESDKRLERIIAGDPDIPGSRERSILGKLDRDHARLERLEKAEESRKVQAAKRKRTAMDWLKELVAPGLGALLVLAAQWLLARAGR